MASLLVRKPTSPLLAAFFERTRTRVLNGISLSEHAHIPTPLPAPNPFIPRYKPDTRCWVPPMYSKRRQKELLKAAAAEGLLEWMPQHEGEKVGGGRKAMKAAWSENAVVEHETELEGGAEEMEVKGESAVIEITSGAPSASTPADVLAQAAKRIVRGVQHEPRTNTTPQVMTDRTAPFQWIGIPNPIYAHETVYGARAKGKWFKGHRWQKEKQERKKEVQRNVETMDERIADYRARGEARKTRTRAGLPF